MKKILTACVLTVISTISFANDTKTQKLAELIAYSIPLGTNLNQLFQSDKKVFENQGWKITTNYQKNCITQNLSDKGFANVILPQVAEFTHQRTDNEIQSYIYFYNNGFANTFRKLNQFQYKNLNDVVYGKITEQQAQQNLINFKKKLSQKDLNLIKEFTTNAKYKPLFDFIALHLMANNNSVITHNELENFVAKQCHL